ncbi:FecR family protein [Falsirhodobacter sp. 20TX0035]|uniref:FecR family protein n=1 Tax=Falsirhodobacter sp. 20TX0035 TaxID=3022019 RepID=UPI002330CFA6|nr:DUF4880 domain-containing protein [Falsirhodobacter sp. 20TX0035]MDB6454262.1 DUF4880 domain-containing protein [Falsirhodobacter sp. 20TX0035]
MSLRDDACARFVRLRSPHCTGAEREAHCRWLADPGHAAAFRAVEEMWGELGDLRDVAAVGPARLSRRRVLAMGGGGLVAASAGAALVWPRSDFATPAARLARLPLPDGADLLLDAASRANLDAPVRHVHVRAGRARLRVGATEYQIIAPRCRIAARAAEVTIHLWDGQATVACHAGEVRLHPLQRSTIALAAGQEVSLDDALHVAPLSETETAWTSDRLVFHDRPLRQVVADLERWRGGRIILRGDHRDMAVTGTFDATRPEAALDALVAALPITRHDLPWLTVLST